MFCFSFCAHGQALIKIAIKRHCRLCLGHCFSFEALCLLEYYSTTVFRI